MKISFYQFLMESDSPYILQSLRQHYRRLADQHKKEVDADADLEPGDKPLYDFTFEDHSNGSSKGFQVEDKFSDRHHEEVLDSLRNLIKAKGGHDIVHENWEGWDSPMDNFMGARQPYKPTHKHKTSILHWSDNGTPSYVRVDSDRTLGPMFHTIIWGHK